MRALFVGAMVVGLVVPGAAHAGRTRFAWVYDVETVPERGVELETWIVEQNGRGDAGTDETMVWWAPIVGITDRVELAMPIELVFAGADGMGATQLARYGAEVRWRLTNPDPVEGGPFAAVIRVGGRRFTTARDDGRADLGVVLGYDAGRVYVGVDLGANALLGQDEVPINGRAALGISVVATGELRFGVEAHGEGGLSSSAAPDWFAVGPNLAWTHGRFWLATSVLIGIDGIESAPRLNWAVAF